VRIGVDYDRARLRDGARQHIGGEDFQERYHVLQRKQYLRRDYDLKFCRDHSRGIYANGIIVFEIEYTREGFR